MPLFSPGVPIERHADHTTRPPITAMTAPVMARSRNNPFRDALAAALWIARTLARPTTAAASW